jgi:hypothetical protein
LERARSDRGAQRGVESTLDKLRSVDFKNARQLLRLHEVLLYFRAFPARRGIAMRAESLLASFVRRVAALAPEEGDASLFDDPANSGIAGSSVTLALSFEILCWLRTLRDASVEIAWADDDDADRLGSTLPRFVPLLEEEALADANVPYVRWIDAARRRQHALRWLIERFERVVPDRRERAALFDSMEFPVEWRFGASRWSRTVLRAPGDASFVHGHRLLSNAEMRADPVAAGKSIRIRRMPKPGASRAMSAARAALACRYREIYGLTYGELRGAIQADAGRGVRFFVFGLPVDRRLPLRAGFTALVVRNGVPIGYGDAFGLFERVDLSFNIFPEYRDGESAFAFRALLGFYRRFLGATVFSIEPYQIGFDNEEAIASGAFWFYRKLGFRPAAVELEKLALREEGRIAARRGYRTSNRVLRRLAGSNMILQTNGSDTTAWDRFHIRNLGLEVNRRMGALPISPAALRDRCAHRIARVLNVPLPARKAQRRTFADLSLVLDRIPNISRWSADEKRALASILEAKAASSEIRYVRLLQKHARLRAAVLRMGSARG